MESTTRSETISNSELDESLKRGIEVEYDINEWELSADGSHLKSKVTGIRVNEDDEIHLQYMTPDGEYEADESALIPYEWDESNFLVNIAKANDIERQNFSDIINADIRIRSSGDNWKAVPPTNTDSIKLDDEFEINDCVIKRFIYFIYCSLVVGLCLAGIAHLLLFVMV